jgi:Domain of unknown function (DUF4062)
MKRPTIFLSSTIYDFQDLRSALKDYLEQRGCTVFASDFNDFAKVLDRHSYDDCLATIEQCDLFVLFIGSRVGGIANAETKTSITRAEYEHAYSLAQKGLIRIVSFVRNDVWTHRESVKEMQRHLQREDGLQTEAEPVRAPSKFMTDAETIISFIETVSRNAETGAAVRGEGPFPVANWIHRFSTFPEIRAVLDPLITGGLDVSQALGRRVLLVKLKTLLQGIVFTVTAGNAVAPSHAVEKLIRDINVQVSDIGKDIPLGVGTWTNLIMLATMVSAAKADASAFIPTLGEPLLFEYDPASGKFSETAEQRELTMLVSQIASFNQGKAAFDAVALMHGKTVRNPPVMARAEHVVSALSMMLSWAAMAENAIALAAAMQGSSSVSPRPLPLSPFLNQQEGLEKEQVTLAHIDALIDKRISMATAANLDEKDSIS